MNLLIMKKIFNYCKESFEEEDKVDDFNYSKNKIEDFVKTLINQQSNTENSLLYTLCYGVRFQKNKKTHPCSELELQNEINQSLFVE